MKLHVQLCFPTDCGTSVARHNHVYSMQLTGLTVPDVCKGMHTNGGFAQRCNMLDVAVCWVVHPLACVFSFMHLNLQPHAHYPFGRSFFLLLLCVTSTDIAAVQLDVHLMADCAFEIHGCVCASAKCLTGRCTAVCGAYPQWGHAAPYSCCCSSCTCELGAGALTLSVGGMPPAAVAVGRSTYRSMQAVEHASIDSNCRDCSWPCILGYCR
jgi:hypothetical protein